VYMNIKRYIFVVIAMGVLFSLWLFLGGPDQKQEDVFFQELPDISSDSDQQTRKVIPRGSAVNPAVTLPFDQVLSKEPSLAFQSVLNQVHDDVYAILPCTVGAGDTEVLLFTAKYTQDPSGNTIQPARDAVTAWEPYVLQDIGSIIYPDQQFTALTSSFIPVSGETDVRIASVQIQGTEYYVYSKWTLNYVLFGSSLSCVEEAQDSVFGH